MSAYICDKHHIVYLVKAAMSRRLNPGFHGPFTYVYDVDREKGTYQHDSLPSGDYDKAAEIANMLWRENIKSVSARYPGESSATLPGPVNVEFVIKSEDFWQNWETFNPVQVLKSIRCFNYQSCEHDDWEKSQAFAFLRALEVAAINALDGYEEAEWGAPESRQQLVAHGVI